MSANELTTILIYGGVAFAFACTLVIAQGVAFEISARFGRFLLAAILPVITLAIVVSTAFSGRSLKFASMDVRSIVGENGGAGDGSWALRATTAVLLAISFTKIFEELLLRRKFNAALQPSKLVYAGFVLHFTANVVLPSIFGTKPMFVANTLYSVVLFAAVFIARKEPLGPTINCAKFALLLMMLGSLLLAVLKPDLVVQPNYQGGWIPGLKIRLWGLGTNPNSIGPLALALLLLESMQPSSRLWVRFITWTLAVAVLMLAQSKTVWLSALLVGAILYIYRNGRQAGGGLKIHYIVVVIFSLLLISLSVLFIDIDNILHTFYSSKTGGEISTLTGRIQIWAVAIQFWEEAPLFGYGLGAWGPANRAALGMPFAFHAHNQFFQSLSVAGTLGFLSTVVYFIVLVRAALNAANRTRGISLGLMLFVAIRCVSEVPLDVSGFGSSETFIHLLLFMLVVNAAPLPEGGGNISKLRIH